MHILLNFTKTAFVMIVTAVILQSACGVSQVTLSLDTSLEMGKSACPEEEIKFTCNVTGSRILSWSSNECIGSNGFQLEFSTFDENGLRINSSVSPDTYATLDMVINANGIFSLRSTLHIIVSNLSSVVSCLSINNSTRKSIDFNVLDELPGMPQNAAAVESSVGEPNCVVLIEWDPPSNIDSPNIEHYVINTYIHGKSNIIMTNATTLATFLSPCNDLSDIDISIAAIDRCERMGMNTRNFTPTALDPTPAPTAPTTTAPTPTAPNARLDITTVLVSIIISLITMLISLTIMVIIIYTLLLKRIRNSGETKPLLPKNKRTESDNDNAMERIASDEASSTEVSVKM